MAVLIGVSLSIFFPALASAAPGPSLPAGSSALPSCTGTGGPACTPSSEPATVAPTTATEPDVPVVGAKRKPRANTSTPPVSEPDSGPPPVDVTPPAPQPEPSLPGPAAPPPPETVSAPGPPVPAPAARAPAGAPNVPGPHRLPTTGDDREALYTAAAGLSLALGGLCIAIGARRRAAAQRPVTR